MSQSYAPVEFWSGELEDLMYELMWLRFVRKLKLFSSLTISSAGSKSDYRTSFRASTGSS